MPGMVTTFLALSLLLGTASPALATGETGRGTGSGTENSITTDPANPPPFPPPLCLKVTQSEYEVVASGTVTASSGAVVYNGDIDIVLDTDHTTSAGDYYIAPEGTYGDATLAGVCNPATFGPLGNIPVNVTISADGPGTSGVGSGIGSGYSCSGAGQYYRVNTNVTFTWTADCDVSDGTTTASDTNTKFVLEGNLLPIGVITHAAYVQDPPA
jgi:hypothetical protein